MKKRILISFLSILIINSCKDTVTQIEQPVTETKEIFVAIDSTHYSIEFDEVSVPYIIHNESDSSKYIDRCCIMSFIVQKKTADVWGNYWGPVGGCRGDCDQSPVVIQAKSQYYEDYTFYDEGVFRFLIEYSKIAYSYRTHLDSIFTQEFIITKLPTTNWTRTEIFTNKYTGVTKVFTPTHDQLCIKFTEETNSDQLLSFASSYNLSLVINDLDSNHIAVFRVMGGEPLTQIGEQIINDPIVFGALPVYRNEQGAEIYIDPKWCIIQFNSDVTQERIQQIFTMYGREIVKELGPQLFIVRYPWKYNKRNWTIFNELKSLEYFSEVKYVEPVIYL